MQMNCMTAPHTYQSLLHNPSSYVVFQLVYVDQLLTRGHNQVPNPGGVVVEMSSRQHSLDLKVKNSMLCYVVN